MTNPNETPDNQENTDKTVTPDVIADVTGDSGEAPPTWDELNEENETLYNENIKMAEALLRAQNENAELNKKLGEKTTAIEEVKADARKSIEQLEKKSAEDKKTAVADFVKNMLPFIDTLEDGLAAISKEQRETDPKFDTLAKGFEGNMSKLTAVFNKFGVKAINPEIDEDFDEVKHLAIKIDDEATGESNVVTRVVKKGYEMEGRIIRTAAVFVSP